MEADTNIFGFGHGEILLSVIYFTKEYLATYDHRLNKTGHPVRSAIHKLEIGRLVVVCVTTSESLLLYVFACFYASFFLSRYLFMNF